MRLNESLSTNRRAAVLILVTASLVALTGIVALALEGGALMQIRRRSQAVAEAGALSGAVELMINYYDNGGIDIDGKAKDSALQTLKDHGFENGGQTSVTVNIPPLSGKFVGEPGYVEVIVEFRFQRGFSAIFGGGNVPVRARAVARGQYYAVSDAIIVLDPHEEAALSSSGNGDVTVIGAPMQVNSDHPDSAGVASGGGWVYAEPLNITGGVDTNGGSGGGFGGTVNEGAPPIPDPLRHLPVPDPLDYTIQSYRATHISGNTTVHLYPVVYKGGISITGKAKVQLAPGIYYIDGGGFKFSGQGSLEGEGVMIYNAPVGNNQNQKISITGSGEGTVNLTPPLSGPYRGISLFQERSADINMNIEGNGGFAITGTFYNAGGLLKIQGNGDAGIGSQYISRLLDLGGNGNFHVTYDAFIAPSIRIFNLVE